ncbi:MAG: CPBP family intramembrane glutamic endopeptidase [Ilumatobacteraceae bacterium]
MESSHPDGHRTRHLSIIAFIGIVVIYLTIIQVGGLIGQNAADIEDKALVSVEDVLVTMWIPLGIALVFTFGVVAALGWWRPVLHDDKPVQRWLAVVPIVLIIAILIGINFGELGDKGIGYVLVLLVATQFVGWGEEGMFRGIGVVAFRVNGFSEGKVAFWSSLIFGAVHLSNGISRGASAIPQAIIVSFAGYFFYLTRRWSRGNALNSILHGLFDFALISSTAIVVDQKVYAGSFAPILVYVILAVVLLVRRHRIEPAPVI